MYMRARRARAARLGLGVIEESKRGRAAFVAILRCKKST